MIYVGPVVIFPTVEVFVVMTIETDLKTRIQKQGPFYYKSRNKVIF